MYLAERHRQATPPHPSCARALPSIVIGRLRCVPGLGGAAASIGPVCASVPQPTSRIADPRQQFAQVCPAKVYPGAFRGAARGHPFRGSSALQRSRMAALCVVLPSKRWWEDMFTISPSKPRLRV